MGYAFLSLNLLPSDPRAEYALPHGFQTPIPWPMLKTKSTRFFVYPDNVTSFATLDPQEMSRNQAFHMLDVINEAQGNGEDPPFKFSLNARTLNDLDGGDIEEIPDHATPEPPKPKTPRKKANTKVAASPCDTIDFGPTLFTAEHPDGEVEVVGATDDSQGSISADRQPVIPSPKEMRPVAITKEISDVLRSESAAAPSEQPEDLATTQKSARKRKGPPISDVPPAKKPKWSALPARETSGRYVGS
jgi:hypothetical protein